MAKKVKTVKKSHRPLALTSPKQRQGSRFEQQACQFLQRQGLILVAQNWQQPKVGELDLVMLEKGAAWSTLVFIEVRQRRRSNFGDAALSVTKAKQRKIIKTAKYFLQQHPQYADCDCRFDVIAYNLTHPTVNPAVSIEAIEGKKDPHNPNISSANYAHLSDHSNRSSTKTADLEVTDLKASGPQVELQPEWLTGAFVATAW